MAQLTKEQEAVRYELNGLWFEHYTDDNLTTEQRIKIVEDFTDKHLESIDLYEPVFYHPMNILKKRYDGSRYSVLDILGDFIMHANMHVERNEENPVLHAEQELTNADERKGNEVGIYSGEVDERVPTGYIHENIIRLNHKPKRPPGVEEVRQELTRVKEFAEYWASTLSEEYGYNKSDVLQRIKALDLDRVKECLICGGGFYTRDLRRKVCDQQHGIDSKGKRSKRSACEMIAQQRYNAEYYKNSVS